MRHVPKAEIRDLTAFDLDVVLTKEVANRGSKASSKLLVAD
jgi:hypothetical protein